MTQTPLAAVTAGRFPFRILALVLLAGLFAFPLAAGAQPGQSGTVLAYLIELHRRQKDPCPGRTFPTPPPLVYSEPLSRAAEELAIGGRNPEEVLAGESLRARRHYAFSVGEERADAAMNRLRTEQCEHLMEEYTHIGAAQVNGRWWVILATLYPVPPGGESEPSPESQQTDAVPVQPEGMPNSEMPEHVPAEPGNMPDETASAVPPPLSPVLREPLPALSGEPLAVLERINAYRRSGTTCGGEYKGPAPALVVDADLTSAAVGHVTDMAGKGYFATRSPEGVGLEGRVRAVGYEWGVLTELISKGPPPAAAVVDLWLSNPGQCAQLMNPSFKDVGVAYSSEYWAIIMAEKAIGVPSQERPDRNP